MSGAMLSSIVMPYGVTLRASCRRGSRRARRAGRGAARSRSRRSRARSGTCPAARRSRGTRCRTTVFVLQRKLCSATSGSQYALSTWNTARSLTGPDRSAEKPQRDASVRSSAEDAAVVVEADVVRVRERVALAGGAHVVVAVEPQLDGAAGPARDQRRDAREQRHLRFLAAEAAAHAPALHDDVVRGEPRARARPCAALRPDAAWTCGSCTPPCSRGIASAIWPSR